MGGCSMNFDDVFYARGLRAWTSTWGQAADATATEAELCEGTTLVSGCCAEADVGSNGFYFCHNTAEKYI